MAEVLKSYSRLVSETSEATSCSNYAVQSINEVVHGHVAPNTPYAIKILVKYTTLQKEESKCCVWWYTYVFVCVSHMTTLSIILKTAIYNLQDRVSALELISWLAREPHGYFCFHLLSARTTSVLTWVLRAKLWSSCLQNKHCPNTTISPAPSSCFFSCSSMGCKFLRKDLRV